MTIYEMVQLLVGRGVLRRDDALLVGRPYMENEPSRYAFVPLLGEIEVRRVVVVGDRRRAYGNHTLVRYETTDGASIVVGVAYEMTGLYSTGGWQTVRLEFFRLVKYRDPIRFEDHEIEALRPELEAHCVIEGLAQT